MDLHQLRTFLSVAAESTLTRASTRLCLSQPAVSAHIKALEDELGIGLFIRTGRGMSLTPAGHSLLPYAERVLAERKALLDEALRLKGAVVGRLRLGIASAPEALRVGDLVRRMSEQFPKLELQLRHGTSRATTELVKDDQLDAGLVLGSTTNDQNLAYLELAKMGVELAVPTVWNQDVGTMGWQEILALPWVSAPASSFCHELQENFFREHGARPKKLVDVDDEGVAHSLMTAGVGVGLLHEDRAAAAASAREVVLWQGFHEQAKLFSIHRRGRENQPLLAALAGVLRSIWDLPLS